MPADQWYYRLDGRPHGPFSAAQFEKLIRGKTVTPDTDVSRDGQRWQPLREALAGASDPPPAPAEGPPPDWMNAPTLMPGELKMVGRKPDSKPPV